jgi:ketosteroid isomerase-like protein
MWLWRIKSWSFSMRPDERVALVRRSFAAWNADDWQDQLRAIWSPEGTIIAPEGWPEAGEFEGWSRMVEEWNRIKDSWGEERVEPLEIESIRERVLGHVRWTMRGEASGAPLEVDVWLVAECEDGRLSRMAYFLDGESARTAAEAGE